MGQFNGGGLEREREGEVVGRKLSTARCQALPEDITLRKFTHFVFFIATLNALW